MGRYIVRRILSFIPVLFTVALFTFVLVRIIPGGPFDYAGEKALPPQIRANLEAKYHLDWPISVQFLSYLFGDDVVSWLTGGKYGPVEGQPGSKGLIRGDFGPSLRYRGQTVTDIIKITFPISFQLGLLAMVIGVGIGIPAGIVAALKQNTWLDYTATFIAVLGVSVPSMVLGPVLIWLFAIKLGWLPVATWGAKPPFILGLFPRKLDWNFWSHAIMPALAMGTGMSASIARLTRASLLQVIREDYIRTARAKGLPERVVIAVHALKNSLIPVVTILGPIFAAVVTGSLVIEQIFGINGMGRHFVQSVGNRDYPLLMGVTLVYTVLLVVANLLVDLTYAWLDPRIRYD